MIENYILIQTIDVNLTSGFNVFTGETGSGKSMLVDAINFVMGQRSTPSVVGRQGNSARVEMTLSVSDAALFQKLEDLGIPYESDEAVLVSRELFKDGRNVSRVNGRSVTLSMVKDLLADVVDVHSQHETQGLLDPKNHRFFMDLFADHDALISAYAEAFANYETARKDLDHFKTIDLNERDVENAQKEIHMFETFKPTLDDYDALNQSLTLAQNFERNHAYYESIVAILKRDSDLLSKLYEGFKPLESLNNDVLLGQYRDAYFNLEDVYETILKIQNNENFDAFEFERLQERLYTYQKLLKRYGDFDGIETARRDYEALILRFERYDDVLLDYENALASALVKLNEEGLALRASRMESARVLEREIVVQLQDLLLENARFSVQFEQKNQSSDGLDAIQFLVSMNKGEPLKPLDKVASGGELSRLMLGLKVILSRIFGIKTIVFDEIDTGVSGRAGLQIGAKMKMLGETCQVLTISHLSSVAACATTHFAISKSQDDRETFTAIKEVSGAQRIAELAMIMSGTTSQAAKDTARELLDEGQAL